MFMKLSCSTLVILLAIYILSMKVLVILTGLYNAHADECVAIKNIDSLAKPSASKFLFQNAVYYQNIKVIVMFSSSL